MQQDSFSLPSTVTDDPVLATPPTPSRLSRRQLLRSIAVGSAVVAGGGLLAACGGGGANGNGTPTTVNVTLLASGGWPVSSLDYAKTQKDPFYKAYVGWLNDWMKKNPGVTIKASNANIWDQKALSTAITAGTSATWFQANVLGNQTDSGTRAAFAKGLTADTTSLYQTYRSVMNLTDYAENAWKGNWLIAGHYYGAPSDYFPGRGIYYRRDFLQAAGVSEPQNGWTWNDLRQMAKALTTSKHKGIVFQGQTINALLTANQFGNLTVLPASTGSNWHWKYDYTSKLDEWQQLVDIYRGMVFTDKSVEQDPNYGEGEAEKAFFRGEVAMAEMHSSFYTHPATSDPASPLALAEQLKKPLQEVVGYMIDPNGTNGAFGAVQGGINVIGFDPKLSKTALDKAFNLYTNFWLGDGVVQCNIASYHADGSIDNLRSIFQSVTPTNKGLIQTNSIPGSSRTYWGDKVVDALLKGAQVPFIPEATVYVPPEQVAGPPPTSYNDAINKLAFSQASVKDILTNLEQTMNQQASTLPSNASQDDFNKGAKAFYDAYGKFWQTNGPDFYTNEYQPWYQKNVAPIIGG